METNLNSENITENFEFNFIRRLREKQAAKKRLDSRKISVPESSSNKRLRPSGSGSDSGRKKDSDSQPTRPEKIPKRDSSSSSKSPEQKKLSKITWP